MNAEEKTCQNCKAAFTVEPEDFSYYEKVKVPPPTFCPDCRLQRRLAFMNLSNLYRRKCDLCKKDGLSMFHLSAPYRVYCHECWWSDAWDPFEYGRDVDFSRPFLEQYNELLHEVPVIGLTVDTTNVNSPYVNLAGHVKNSYLIFHADFDEDCLYGFYVVNNKSLVDCSLMMNSELCYDSMHAYKCSGCVGLRSQVTESLNSAFLKDCDNCQDCFGSANLRGKKYYIFNEPYSREGYIEEMKKWNLGSYAIYKDAERRANEAWKSVPPCPYFMDFSVNCTGNNIFESKNCRDSFEVIAAQDSRFVMMQYLPTTKDCYDTTSWGNNASLCYEASNVGEGAAQVRFSQESGINAFDIEYSKAALNGARHQFGCSAIRKTPYCILNKAYSENEYKILRKKVIAHMDAMPYTDMAGNIYRYGEFFPLEFMPFPYNITLANSFFPLAKEKAVAKGLRWHDDEPSTYATTIKAADLPDHIRDIDDAILKEVIACAKCGRGYRVIEAELRFLKGRNLPLPRECPFCRIAEKIGLWAARRKMTERNCAECGATFEACYTQAEAPRILCKSCWQKQLP